MHQAVPDRERFRLYVWVMRMREKCLPQFPGFVFPYMQVQLFFHFQQLAKRAGYLDSPMSAISGQATLTVELEAWFRDRRDHFCRPTAASDTAGQQRWRGAERIEHESRFGRSTFFTFHV